MPALRYGEMAHDQFLMDVSNHLAEDAEGMRDRPTHVALHGAHQVIPKARNHINTVKREALYNAEM